MNSLTRPFLLALALSSTCMVMAEEDPCAQPSPQEMAKELGIKLPRRPWHLANIWWTLEKPEKDFKSLEVDISIDRDVPETYNLYISPCGSAQINGIQFYGGIQSNVNGWPSKESRERVHPGRGAIFSRWSHDKKTPIGLEHVDTAGTDCLVESAGYEGEFASVRRPYTWGKGTYTWGVYKGKTIDFREGKATWFTCRVTHQATGEVTDIGSLLFEGETFTYRSSHSAFVEVYATAKIPNSNIPKVNVTFSRPRINGEKAPLKRVTAFYPDDRTPSTSSPDCAIVRADGENCVVEIGPIFKRDEGQRQHSLDIQ